MVVLSPNGFGLAEVVEFERQNFNKPQKPNRTTNVQNMYFRHHFGKPMLAVVRFIFRVCQI